MKGEKTMRMKLLIGAVLVMVLGFAPAVGAEGTGWWLGDVAGTPKFSIGNPAGDYLRWTGSVLESKSQYVTIDATGLSIASAADPAISRMYGFNGAMIGMAYYTDPTHNLTLYTDSQIEFLKTGEPGWAWYLYDQAFYPAGAGYSVGKSTFPVDDFYGITYHSKQGILTYDGTTFSGCSPGDFVSFLEVNGGIVTNAGCTSPLSLVKASDVAALRSLIAAQDSRIKALETELAGQKAAR
jgi:hypothetical protein